MNWLRSVLLATAVALFACSSGDWTPPEDPDPQQILDEARAAGATGDYSNALARHIWFHENALKYQPSLAGVRLSFALTYWRELGERYPEAREALERVRDRAEQAVKHSTATFESFLDAASINRELGDTARTVELFIWVVENNSGESAVVFDLAKDALIEQRRFDLMSGRLDADAEYAQIRDQYRQLSNLARDDNDAELENLAESNFRSKAATLVAVLVNLDEQASAKSVAGLALRELPGAEFKVSMDGAMTGKLPD